eukprot:6201552-Pleurochrysis_carterae.AAC.2
MPFVVQDSAPSAKEWHLFRHSWSGSKQTILTLSVSRLIERAPDANGYTHSWTYSSVIDVRECEKAAFELRVAERCVCGACTRTLAFSAADQSQRRALLAALRAAIKDEVAAQAAAQAGQWCATHAASGTAAHAATATATATAMATGGADAELSEGTTAHRDVARAVVEPREEESTAHARSAQASSSAAASASAFAASAAAPAVSAAAPAVSAAVPAVSAAAPAVSAAAPAVSAAAAAVSAAILAAAALVTPASAEKAPSKESDEAVPLRASVTASRTACVLAPPQAVCSSGEAKQGGEGAEAGEWTKEVRDGQMDGELSLIHI